MSSRTTYARYGADLADWIAENGGEEESIGLIVAHLCDSGSMTRFVVDHDLNWGVLAAWIRKSPERNSLYSQAMLDRGQIRKEKLLDGWWETADSVVDDAPGHVDVHRAREALAKAEGVFKDSVSAGGGITIRFDSVDQKA